MIANQAGRDGRWHETDTPVEVFAVFIEIRILDCKSQVCKCVEYSANNHNTLN